MARDDLTEYDADELRDVADRAETDAETAHRLTEETSDPDTQAALAALASSLATAAWISRTLATRIDPEGKHADG